MLVRRPSQHLPLVTRPQLFRCPLCLHPLSRGISRTVLVVLAVAGLLIASALAVAAVMA